MKPLLFNDVYKPYIWGGRNLEKFGKKLPEGVVAESWELSAHPDGPGFVSEGPFAGRTLAELTLEHGEALVGTDAPEWAKSTFPLLIKFIDANDRLSVQVHPDDAYAFANENGSFGKTEMWVILDAEPGAELIFDVIPGTTREAYAHAVEEGRVESVLQRVPVKKGDALFIPAGKIHAIGAGILIAEIQQNSNTTYRVYDYDRRDAAGNARPLHLEKALDVIDFSGRGEALTPTTYVRGSGLALSRQILAACPLFVVERVSINGWITAAADGTRFHAWTVIVGSLTFKSDGFERTLPAGRTILLPADCGEYQISGFGEALVSYLPKSDAIIGAADLLAAALEANATGLHT